MTHYIPYSTQEAAVLVSKKKHTSHLLHLVLAIITAGLWIPVWFLLAINRSIENGRLERRILKGKRVKGMKR